MPGATLHVELAGSGPVLLLICGAPADAAAYARLATELAGRYTTVSYDPRGYSWSTIDGDEIDLRVEVQAEDAHHLLRAVTDEPAYVLGCGCGSLVGLELAARHPEQVHTLVAHEPPVMELLPNCNEWREFLELLHATYLSEGSAVASRTFMTSAELGPSVVPQVVPPMPDFTQLTPDALEQIARLQGNMDVFFEHQIHPLIGYLPDLDTLRATASKIIVAVGEESKGQAAHSAALVLADRIHREVVDIPGEHQGFSTHPVGWAEVLRRILPA